jgi:hypothetical protein
MTDYFVDLDAASSGSGTFANPWNSPENVESGGLGTGDNCYFKCGTSFSYSGSAGFTVNWSGTSSGSRSHVGAYYDDGGSPETDFATVKSQIDLAIEDYPEIQGPLTSTTVCSDFNYSALLLVTSRKYLYIENLRLTNSNGRHMQFLGDDTTNWTNDTNTVRHCYMYYCMLSNVLVDDYSRNIVFDDNYIDMSGNFGWRYQTTDAGEPGCWRDYAAGFTFIECDNITASNNICRRGWGEMVNAGAYQRPCTNCEIHSNIIEGFWSYGLYIMDQDNSAYNNIILGTRATVLDGTYNYANSYHRQTFGCGSGHATGFSDEYHILDVTTGTKIYNNLIAWTRSAFFAEANTASSTPVSGSFIHNTCVESNWIGHCYILRTNGSWASGYPIIKNNIFVSYQNNSNYDSLVNSSAGNQGTWDYNCWYARYNNKTLPESQGCRGANDVGADPLLNRSTGFYNQIDTYEDATDTDWNILVGSPCDDACVKLTGYETDYYGTTRDP